MMFYITIIDADYPPYFPWKAKLFPETFSGTYSHPLSWIQQVLEKKGGVINVNNDDPTPEKI